MGSANRRPGWIRGVVAALGAAGLLGATAQADALVIRHRAALEARVENLRQAAQQSTRDDPGTPAADMKLAQWLNWPNWNNWNNWPNWGNWGNWGNWFNR
jgi:hypothetical protein